MRNSPYWYCLRTSCLLLGLLSVLGAVAVSSSSVSAAQVTGIPHSDGKECAACHKKIGTPAFNAKSGKDCHRCHSLQAAVGNESQTQPMNPNPPLPAEDKSDEPLPPGMNLPMYYPKSRLGDAPNPMILIPAG